MYKYTSRVRACLVLSYREPQRLVVITWRPWLALDSDTWQPSTMVWISNLALVLSYRCTCLVFLSFVFCIYSLLAM